MSRLPSWRGWALLAVAAGLLGALVAPGPEPASKLVTARRDSWSLAALPRRFDQTTMAGTLVTAAFWGGAPDTSAAATASVPPPDMRWRIAAVFGVGKEAGVLVVHADETKPPQRFRVGETLPSGHRISSIGERDVCVRIGSKTYRLGVERRDE